MSRNDILSANVPLPPLEEQAAIVRYLDYVNDLINRYISAKEQLIALLEEQRRAVIRQAVTRGLDLKGETHRKASGVRVARQHVPDSIGTIRRVKRLYYESDERELALSGWR